MWNSVFRVMLGFFPACVVLRPPTIFQLNFFLDAIVCHQALEPAELLIVCGHGCVSVPLCFGFCSFFAYVWLAGCLLPWLCVWLAGWLLSLCLCLGQGFVNWKSEFLVSVPVSGPGLCELPSKFESWRRVSVLQKYQQMLRNLAVLWLLLLCLECTMHMYGHGHTFWTFQLHFFFSIFFSAFLMGATLSKISSKVKGGTLFRA